MFPGEELVKEKGSDAMQRQNKMERSSILNSTTAKVKTKAQTQNRLNRIPETEEDWLAPPAMEKRKKRLYEPHSLLSLPSYTSNAFTGRRHAQIDNTSKKY